MNNTATTYSRSPKRAAKRQAAKPKKRVSQAPKNQQPRPSGRHSGDHPPLPGWNEVHAKENIRKKRARSAKKNTPTADQLSTKQFALYTFVAVLLMSLYVSHVFATQKALAKLEEVRRHHEQLTLEYNQKKASFDHLVRPDQVYHRAKELGFTEGTVFGPPILWKPEHTD